MSRFLEQIDVDAYGGLRDKSVGPFGPGLNVVYGPNEAGKTTLASFVGGVLFGWEEARGVRNTYRPDWGERSGSLVFADRDNAADKQVVSRGRNEDGLQGDARLVSDVDNVTYRTMFSLTSDELRALKSSSDVTARLLTAGAGTGSSPAEAFVEIEQQIAAHTSRAEDASESVIRLGERLEEARERMQKLAEAEDLRRQESRELADLVAARALAAARLDEESAALEALRAARAKIETIDAQAEARAAALSSLEEESNALALERGGTAGVDPRLLALDSASERLLRDRLDELSDDYAKAARSVDVARENSAASTAAYEALLEVDGEQPKRSRRLAGREVQAFVSVALPVAFVLAGVLVFAHARQIHSLAFTALGIGLIVLAFFLAAAALVVLFRPDSDAEALEGRRKDAQWVMLQDKKKLDAVLAAREQVEMRIEDELAEAGLRDAGGSVRQARALLDEARDVRLRDNALAQRAAALRMRIDTERESARALTRERREVEASAGLERGISLVELDALIVRQSEQRGALSASYDDMNQRFGELEQRLRQAREDGSFSQAKLDLEQIRSQLRERKRELVTLLLAKRMLEKSIAAWESQGQPEVYARASELFSTMTGGAWSRIAMTTAGRLVAVAADGTQREIRHLSLGTCQQLYLSLRVAMLLHAHGVGRSIPVLADDIVVNFDAQRRRACAQVLARLAEERQVIVLTCHRETVEALKGAAPDLTYLEL